ncbi:extracellular solute-binding protein [Paenibacillus sp. SYP-B3998]|uniref:Extracellular solute-binding protein n=1 Tax=Paenibacillus sp. SYP-B3998 TaxID=2678564 RepID=A0A6G4A188_9BACL|nr:extracellular solute-binding protein [Paenibacillus sp. SYP-B3998]NEW07407.1 extracellular solute-binding protein [Paenibacillus sp. SYP-B3998]
MWKKALLTLVVVALVFLGFRLFGEKKSNQALKVYVIFQEDEGRILLETFKKKTDQPYELIRMSSGEASYHLLTLGKTGIDVVLGGPADLHEQLKTKSKSLRYLSPAVNGIPGKYKDSDGYWTGMYMGALAIGVNQTVWQQDPQLAALPMPQRYEDLLRPELKGKIEIPDPETSGTGYTLLASLAQQRGEAQAIDLMQALKKQSASTTFAGITSAQRLAEGEVATVVSFLGDQLRFKNSGYNISSLVPPQVGWEIGAVSILKGGNNPAAAKQLVDFMLSREVQTDYMNTAFSFPVTPDIPVNPLLAPVKLENLLATYRFDLAAQHREQLLSQWRAALE